MAGNGWLGAFAATSFSCRFRIGLTSRVSDLKARQTWPMNRFFQASPSTKSLAKRKIRIWFWYVCVCVCVEKKGLGGGGANFWQQRTDSSFVWVVTIQNLELIAKRNILRPRKLRQMGGCLSRRTQQDQSRLLFGLNGWEFPKRNFCRNFPCQIGEVIVSNILLSVLDVVFWNISESVCDSINWNWWHFLRKQRDKCCWPFENAIYVLWRHHCEVGAVVRYEYCRRKLIVLTMCLSLGTNGPPVQHRPGGDGDLTKSPPSISVDLHNKPFAVPGLPLAWQLRGLSVVSGIMRV